MRVCPSVGSSVGPSFRHALFFKLGNWQIWQIWQIDKSNKPAKLTNITESDKSVKYDKSSFRLIFGQTNLFKFNLSVVKVTFLTLFFTESFLEHICKCTMIFSRAMNTNFGNKKKQNASRAGGGVRYQKNEPKLLENILSQLQITMLLIKFCITCLQNIGSRAIWAAKPWWFNEYSFTSGLPMLLLGGFYSIQLQWIYSRHFCWIGYLFNNFIPPYWFWLVLTCHYS